ncbi:MAG: DUF192 domain-containing protein [Lentisphaerota bacterium]
MILNLTKKKYLARSPLYAISYILRMRGMIGRTFSGADFDAMVFSNCNTIHTMFMSVRIDVVFVTRDNIVCGLKKALPPWMPFVRCCNALTTLELPEGTIDLTGTQIGDIVDLCGVLTAESEQKLKENNKLEVETVISFKESNK